MLVQKSVASQRLNGKGDVFKYDDTDQLTNVLYEATNPDTTPTAATNEVRYVFDAAGNRTSVMSTNIGTAAYVANALNQYTNVGGTTMKYDGNGNPTNVVEQASSLSLGYDRENRLIKAASATVGVTNVYDAFNRLIERQLGTNKVRYIYDNQWRILAEYYADESVAAKYVYGPEIDEPVKVTIGLAKRYFHQAALGTVTEITGRLGNINESYIYDVYGAVTIKDASGNVLTNSAIGNRFMFQGRDRDPDTGLYNFRMRYYSATLGRFLQVDPIRVKGGYNLYRYVRNHPATWVDPFGLAGVVIAKVVCDGKGGFTWEWVNGPIEKTDDECTREHEEQHIKDFTKEFPNACKGTPDLCGSGINLPQGFSPYVDPNKFGDFHKRTECAAYKKGLACRRKALAIATDEVIRIILKGGIDNDLENIKKYCGK